MDAHAGIGNVGDEWSLLITKILIFFCQAPSSILESLETHMNGLEDAKGGKKG